ncbi:MAG TPA: bifunctional UDP-3-O-[3-hydroxymyristoyl] N-acetylglucosamine deacetylase/3-hydroxyacyl-ACP dehydratase [Verrucomicrobiae bacterium]|nr:bifunctional UDP-3-O-[3-hydroxymyristoyl] N-acetylglucosamine deacetylase/3-hydroxyacyl-ACP dehydratase [Verrucomicrobiae bacterium]
MSQQQTFRQSASYSGVGLHSGNKVMMTFAPAPANTGIRFRRMDLEGKPEIEARVENVVQTNRSTTLGKGNAKITTVEHVLATMSGFGIDNAVVELDANEPPIGDGSSREYCRMVEEAGIVPQGAARETYRIPEPLELQTEDSLISIFPHEQFKISCTSADKAGRFSQYFSIEITPETWKREIAHARTFCFFEEIEFLIKNGLIKGGSLENAVVIRDDAVLTTEPLRYNEEFVRHKILDIIGDLSLIGRPLCGHVIAVRPSHTLNCEMARTILARMRKPLEAMQTFSPPPPAMREPKKAGAAAPSLAEIEKMMADGAALDITQVMNILPHRFPFLLIDRVTRIEGNKITAIKNVTINEPYFQGHFVGHPIMPGVLQLEAMAQAAGILMLKQAENFGRLAYFMAAESVKWRKPVRPGDTLVIQIELTKNRGKIGKAKGVCLVDNEPVSEAEVTFILMDREAQ